ncbi:MAG TPA: DNA-processing protein DprA [Ktedonobacteraceae bacterium]|nr:DNA-processing protein DprA [Ktedonobacteraceae bacterium]
MTVFDSSVRYYPSGALPLDDLAYWIAFSRVPGIGPKRFRQLLTFFQDDVAAAWNADSAALARAGIDQRTADSFLRQRKSIVPQRELERLEKLRITVITWKDKNYPPLLKAIDYAPPVLYVAGKLTEADQFAIAIVGTRNASQYGRQVTEQFAGELAGHNVTIVSGLALGIDTIAHKAALDAGGRTIAVMACGLDTIYPADNHGLAKRIVESGQGALITEFPLGVRPESRYFPTRNRIISGLSLGVLITEAPQKSGALITVKFALEQGREVFAVPGNIFSAKSTGVNKIIQEGAHPVMGVADILESLDLFMIPQQIEMQAILPDNDEERTLLSLLSHEPRHIDELIRESNLPAMTVTSTLTMMELKGMVRQVGSMQFVVGR